MLPVLDFEQEFYYIELVDEFYREMLGGPNATELMGNIRGRVVFSPTTLASAFSGYDADDEALISKETSEKGWKSMRGETT